MDDEVTNALLAIVRHEGPGADKNEIIRRVSFNDFVELTGFSGDVDEEGETEWTNKSGDHCWKVVDGSWLERHTNFQRWKDKHWSGFGQVSRASEA